MDDLAACIQEQAPVTLGPGGISSVRRLCSIAAETAHERAVAAAEALEGLDRTGFTIPPLPSGF